MLHLQARMLGIVRLLFVALIISLAPDQIYLKRVTNQYFTISAHSVQVPVNFLSIQLSPSRERVKGNFGASNLLETRNHVRIQYSSGSCDTAEYSNNPDSLIQYFGGPEIGDMEKYSSYVRHFQSSMTNSSSGVHSISRIITDFFDQKIRKISSGISTTSPCDPSSGLLSISASSVAVSSRKTASFKPTSAAAKEMTFHETMFAGAVSRSIAQTLMHPVNTYKTILQLRSRVPSPAATAKATAGVIASKITFDRLLRGVDAQFLLSLPHGAFHFYTIEKVKTILMPLVTRNLIASKVQFLDAITDFTSSAISTVICSVISTPQMVLTDRLMAGIYPTFPVALSTIMKTEGLLGFYAGWWPALAQKIPSYSLTWMFFQQMKRLHNQILKCKPNSETNFVMGALAAAGSVAVMIPMDTVKTRLVIQVGNCPTAYTGVANCFYRIFREEGLGAFYRSLPPRLAAVVPMIAIQFGVYEHIKNKVLESKQPKPYMTPRI